METKDGSQGDGSSTEQLMVRVYDLYSPSPVGFKVIIGPTYGSPDSFGVLT